MNKTEALDNFSKVVAVLSTKQYEKCFIEIQNVANFIRAIQEDSNHK